MAGELVPTGATAWSADQLRFQAWLAVPTGEREPKTQKALAAEMGRDRATLSDWKRLDGWADAVWALASAHVAHELPAILHAQVREAKRGSLSHAQFLFELAGKWTSKATGPDFNVAFLVGGEPRQMDYRKAVAPLMAPDDGDDG